MVKNFNFFSCAAIVACFCLFAQEAAAGQLRAKTAEQTAGASRGAIVGARVGARAIYRTNTLFRIHGTNAAKSIGRPAGSAKGFKYSKAMKAKKAK